ncbi:uncharacterized protein LOC128220554 isoform X2 [Mya arenaria]|uniref:uncharacterized protein LOC128220554 isoform X2 n=1 Tax=Mya arenaria TaxID=6604 RepID=UPI0022DF6E65|nr:uncharacterized protein LOC128220554 isoform X2 [Mya arenaria]
MHIQVEERVFSSIADSSGCLGSALVAGDSNVHRIQAAIPNWSTIRCLPVSGAKFVNDKKGFVAVLQLSLKKEFYPCVYIHLGSNDVQAREDVFYRRVTEVCDSIHETSPETEIVLCSILPRKKNDRRVSSTLARVFNRWIQNANTMLMDISEAIPYIRFLGYGAQECADVLGRDGLHLSRVGGRHCSQVIEEDVYSWSEIAYQQDVHWNEDIRQPHSAEIDASSFDQCLAAAVEPVSDQNVQASKQPLYSEIVRLPAAEVPDVTSVQHNVKLPRRNVLKVDECARSARPCNHRSNKHGRARRRKFTQHRQLKVQRSEQYKDHVEIPLTSDVTVKVKADNVHSIWMCPKEDAITTKKRLPVCSTMTGVKKINKTWFDCPLCPVKCSREDFLLDHFCRRHVPGGTKYKKNTDNSFCHRKSTKSSRSQPNSKSTISTSSLNPVEKTSPPHQGLISFLGTKSNIVYTIFSC